MNQDFNQNNKNKNISLQTAPSSPILHSQDIISDILRVEHHYQPANGASECCLPSYLLSARAINYGLWNSQEEYAKMNANPPMAEPLKQMRALANNEFQMSLYEVAHIEAK
jgi:hypothetical protein